MRLTHGGVERGGAWRGNQRVTRLPETALGRTSCSGWDPITAKSQACSSLARWPGS